MLTARLSAVRITLVLSELHESVPFLAKPLWLQRFGLCSSILVPAEVEAVLSAFRHHMTDKTLANTFTVKRQREP